MLSACPLEAELVAFAQGESSDEMRAVIGPHLDVCDDCRCIVAELALAASEASEPPPASFDRGDAIGRYLVLDRLGAGAMGVVYAAYDPDLGRRVAIKVLRPRGGSRGASATLTGRLLREAQAMARLTHANVVRVYDVGTTASGQVFVTMEYVEGKTLKAFVAEGSRSWRELLAVCRLAGEGLAAANREQLVHRDFKPENVLVAEDGRVLVTDFGLVRALDEERDEERDATLAGSLLGTPAYMAPEQLAGAPASALSDQYAFAVTVYEALYGARPFAGDTLRELRAAVHSGQMRETPRARAIPSRVHRALTRALRVDPAARYPSMRALLDELDPRPARLLAPRIAFVAFAVALVGVGATMRVRDHRVVACSETDPKLARAWNAEVKGRVRSAFTSNHHAYATDAWRGVEPVLDRYSASVQKEQSDLCRLALADRARASQDRLRGRASCLDERVDELTALTHLFEGGDDNTLVQAVRGAQSLSRVEACSRDAVLQGSGRRADDALRYPGSGELRRQLAVARAHYFAGAFATALAEGEDVVTKARANGSKAILADALVLKGANEDSLGNTAAAEATLDEAVRMADLGENDLARAEALITLGWIAGYRRARFDEGLRYIDYGGAALERIGDNDELAVKRWSIVAAINNARVRPEAALEPGERAAQLAERIYGTDSRRAANSLNTLAGTYYELGRFEDAARTWERTLAIQERTLGPHHPELASTLLNLCGIAATQKRSREARVFLERARAISEETTGLGDELATRILSSLSEFQLRDGEPALALETGERALRVAEQLKGLETPALLPELVAVGAAARALRRFVEARAVLERAARLAKLPDADPRYHSAAELLLAETLGDMGVEGARSLALALDARDVAENGGAIAADDRASADAWLRAHGVGTGEFPRSSR